MNKKILTSALGLVAAASLAGGATFAGWSDNFTEESNTVGAGHITLNVTDNDPATTEFDRLNLIPGGQADYEFLVTSMDSNATEPSTSTKDSASLSLTLEQLLGTEDGCSNTNGEEDDDPDCTSPGTDANALSNVLGDFDDDARVTLNVSAPTTNLAGACSLPRGGVSGVSGSTLRQIAGMGAVDLLAGDTLDQGEGICVAMSVYLPSTVDNASMGDSADFDIRFDLTQNV